MVQAPDLVNQRPCLMCATWQRRIHVGFMTVVKAVALWRMGISLEVPGTGYRFIRTLYHMTNGWMMDPDSGLAAVDPPYNLTIFSFSCSDALSVHCWLQESPGTLGRRPAPSVHQESPTTVQIQKINTLYPNFFFFFEHQWFIESGVLFESVQV